jgi:hypothetical protein
MASGASRRNEGNGGLASESGRGSAARGGKGRATSGRSQSHAPAAQSGRTASGKPTIGATVGAIRGSRRASHPGGR